MSEAEFLRPYTDFDASDLALQLNEAVKASKELLAARNLLGPIARYGVSLELAEEKVRKGQSDENPDHYAVVNGTGDVVGGASIYRGLCLRKLRLPLPPQLARGSLAVEYPYADPNIAAWTKVGEDELLVESYHRLAAKCRQSALLGKSHEAPWTVESIHSPKQIHSAISLAGLKLVITRRFDEGENRRRVPPRGKLYAMLSGQWLTAYGAQKELRTGKWQSWLQEVVDDALLGHNPH